MKMKPKNELQTGCLKIYCALQGESGSSSNVRKVPGHREATESWRKDVGVGNPPKRKRLDPAEAFRQALDHGREELASSWHFFALGGGKFLGGGGVGGTFRAIQHGSKVVVVCAAEIIHASSPARKHSAKYSLSI